MVDSLWPPSRLSRQSSLLLLLVLLHCSSSHALLPRLLPRRLEAVVLDADGSFLDPQHKVSPANAEAVLAARRAGLQVFLATGRARSGPWVQECLVPLSLDCPGVFTQGLTSFDALNQRVHEDKLAASAVAAVQRACESAEKGNGVTLAAYVQERLLVACGDECDPWLMRYSSYGDGEIELAGGEPAADVASSREARGAAPAEAFATESTDLLGVLGKEAGSANKVLVLSDEESVPALRTALEAALEGEPARVVKALDWTLEVLPERTSKAEGLRRLLEHLQINPRRVMAVGDGENDIEMMRMVGLPVAMGNAMQPLKRHVAYVTASNAEDGVAKAIRKHALPRAPANAPRRRDMLRKLLRVGGRGE
mmetsp:Transcript_23638/g.74412  ORF Transcript_23638/g.74412 Transcript_23638/m.74412 type:complete len:367 (-) Transcript_23638:182-1282(-)